MISKKDFYLHWPYKCAYQKNTIPRPYFSKTEVICDHKHSLTYTEWNEILSVYIDELIDFLTEGHKFEMPMMLGYLEMCKWKAKHIRVIGTQEKDENGKMKTKIARDTHTQGYRPILKWRRPEKLCKVSMPWLFSIRMMKGTKRAIYKKFKKNPLKFNDA